MLECRDHSIYTGITNNVKERLRKHQAGNGAKYLRGRLPIKLIYQELSLNRSEATKRELFLKKLSKKEKIILINLSYKKE